MKILCAPDVQFEGLPEWPLESHYTTITDDDGTPIRIAHVEQGPSDGEPILLIHGNPSWSYLHCHIPGAARQAHDVMPTAKHFIQEGEPQWLVERITRFLDVKP